MKYTGKWWDNPKRGEDERRVASFMANILMTIVGFVLVMFLILKVLP